MDKIDIQTLLDKIIKEQFPEELPVYELEKEMLFENAWDQNFSTQKDNEFDGINQGGPIIETVLNCILALFGTVKTVFEIKNLRGAKHSSTQLLKPDALTLEFVREKWLAQLQLAGLDIVQAKTLTGDFSDDLAKILNNDK